MIAARISAHELRAAAASVGPVAICQHASGKWVYTAAEMAKGPAQFPPTEAH